MDKLWKTIGTVVPGPAVLLAGKWIDLFSATHLTYPDWQEAADGIALAVSAVVAVVLSIALGDVSKKLLKVLTWVGLGVFLMGVLACWMFWFRLGAPMAAVDAMWFQDVWQGIYIITMVALVTTITLAALTLREDKPKYFWTLVVGAVVVVLIAAAIWFLWPR